MGNYKKGSDIDIALKGDIDFKALAKIHDILEEELPIPNFFDVVIYKDLTSDALIKHIDTEGRVFYPKTL